LSWIVGLEGTGSGVPPYWLNADRRAGSSFHDIVPAEGFRPAIQELMNSTWEQKWTRDRKDSRGEKIAPGDPHGDMPIGVNVLKVWRVEDSGMWEAYTETRRRIRDSRGGCASAMMGSVRSEAALPRHVRRRCDPGLNEVYLFHGSHPRAVTSIAEDGFDLDLSGSSTSAAYGRGAYFSECSSKADEYSKDQEDGYYKGYYAMLLCRVILGKVQVLAEFDTEACSRLGEGQAFDSTLGDREAVANTYREFVVPSAAQIYPEYAIIYERMYRRPRVRGLRNFPSVAADEDDDDDDDDDEEDASLQASSTKATSSAEPRPAPLPWPRSCCHGHHRAGIGRGPADVAAAAVATVEEDVQQVLRPRQLPLQHLRALAASQRRFSP